MIFDNLMYSSLDKGEIPSAIWTGFPQSIDGKTIFIKPNLVFPPNRFDEQSCTHISVVRMVLQHIFHVGTPRRVMIGDCGFKDQFLSTMELSGYEKLLSDFPSVEIIPLQDGPNYHKYTLHRIETYRSLFGAKISDYVWDSDIIINIPKLKIHSLVTVTGAIKNMMGTMAQKGSMHPGGSSVILHKRLRDLYFLLKNRVNWIIMDGIVGSEYCEHQGVPVETRLLISGTDMWEVDCLATRVMGIDPSSVSYLRFIAEEGRVFPELPIGTEIRPFELPLICKHG